MLLRCDRASLAGCNWLAGAARECRSRVRRGRGGEARSSSERGRRMTIVRAAQSRWASLVEASANVLIGYLLALLTQRLLYPSFGIVTTLADDNIIAAVFTLVSLARSYVLRRLFEQLSWSAR